MNDARPDTTDNTPTSNPVLRQALVWGGIVAAALLVVSGVLGYAFAGAEGLAGALVGTAMAVVFMGITAATILVANRFASSDLFVGAFFGIVLGGWIVKFVVFIVLVVLLRDGTWLDTTVLFLSLVAGVLASLVVDVIVITRSRMPHVSDVELPPAPRED